MSDSLLYRVQYDSRYSTALVCYDFLITFDREVRCVWRRKWTGATVLFILNRYIVLLVHIISLCSFVRTTNLV